MPVAGVAVDQLARSRGRRRCAPAAPAPADRPLLRRRRLHAPHPPIAALAGSRRPVTATVGTVSAAEPARPPRARAFASPPRRSARTSRARSGPAGAWTPRRPAPLLVVHDGPVYDREAGLTAYLQAHVDARRAPAAAGRPAGRRRRATVWFSANPDYAAPSPEHVVPHLVAPLADDARGRHRREPRRARLAARAVLVPGGGRRTVPAVRQLLPARDGPAGERLQRVPGDRAASSRRCAAGGRPTRPVPTVAHLRSGRGEPCEQPADGPRPAPPGVPGALRGRPRRSRLRLLAYGLRPAPAGPRPGRLPVSG